LKEIHIYISADGLAEKKIAQKLTISNGLTTLDMEELDENLKDYLLSSKFKLRAEVVLDGIPATDTQIEISTQYLVEL
jgi:hypothetical protein